MTADVTREPTGGQELREAVARAIGQATLAWTAEADEAWRAANLLRDALYACESCGHSTEPLGLGSNGDHSEDDPTQCWACGPNAAPCLSRGEPA